MLRDPIVAEIRAYREALAERFNGDQDAIFEYFRQQEKLRQQTAEPAPVQHDAPAGEPQSTPR